MRVYACFLAMIVLLAACQKKRAAEEGEPGSPEVPGTVEVGDQPEGDPTNPQGVPPSDPTAAQKVEAPTTPTDEPLPGATREAAVPGQPPPAFIMADPDPAKNAVGYIPEPEGLYGNERSKDGKTLYLGICAPCHAPDGSGEALRKSKPELADLRDPAVHRRRDDAELKALVRGGHGDMPPNRTLKDEQLDALVTFVRTLKR